MTSFDTESSLSLLEDNLIRIKNGEDVKGSMIRARALMKEALTEITILESKLNNTREFLKPLLDLWDNEYDDDAWD